MENKNACPHCGKEIEAAAATTASEKRVGIDLVNKKGNGSEVNEYGAQRSSE